MLFGFRDGLGWWSLNKADKKWEGEGLGWNSYYPDQKVLRWISAKDWDELYKNPLYLEMNKKEWMDTWAREEFDGNAWLDRKGMLHSFGYAMHVRFAQLYMNCSERQLEKDGWVKITSNTAYHCRPLSKAQKHVLDALTSCGGVSDIYELEARR